MTSLLENAIEQARQERPEIQDVLGGLLSFVIGNETLSA